MTTVLFMQLEHSDAAKFELALQLLDYQQTVVNRVGREYYRRNAA